MGFSKAFDISVSGIEANRLHMEMIASNLANISTTRSLGGGPYRRKIPIFSENPIGFADELSRAMGGGVRVAGVEEDPSPFQKIYNPGHPDADKDGYVLFPNVSMSKEMVDLVLVSKLYEANITAFNATKKMANDTLQIQ